MRIVTRRITQPEYDLLDKFLHAVHERIRDGKMSRQEGVETMILPINAFQSGDNQNFVPFMEGKLEAWGCA
jgi:hypothetical protein